MSNRILLLLALTVCAASSLSIIGGRSRCLCHSFEDQVRAPKRFIKSLQVIAPSNSCDNLEIILNLTNGRRVCLNPSAQKIIEVVSKLKSKKGIS
ncbi:hypothetical protein SKAU_G00365280 [Synaphobranchus kaupii]|uniref:Chemokine interleukin-8-like domain-containing protein n=1 Tax=Synaphobranchus kaupii TaxID=118154 RepID=A0A9Q1IF91_SYNKA|nr:hypothetical protein SKAU_G00365280 [Synaphobranchus kaupii]